MRKLWLLAGFVVALVALDAVARRARQTARPAAADSMLAEPFPLRPFDARDIDGRDVSPATWGGRVAVVNFWATWCVPCRREIPALAALQEKYADRLLVIGVLQDDVTPGEARAFGRSVRMNYALVPSTFEIERSFPSIEALPMTFVIDAGRRVVAIHAGEIEPESFERQLRELLNTPNGSIDR